MGILFVVLISFLLVIQFRVSPNYYTYGYLLGYAIFNILYGPVCRIHEAQVSTTTDGRMDDGCLLMLRITLPESQTVGRRASFFSVENSSEAFWWVARMTSC